MCCRCAELGRHHFLPSYSYICHNLVSLFWTKLENSCRNVRVYLLTRSKSRIMPCSLSLGAWFGWFEIQVSSNRQWCHSTVLGLHVLRFKCHQVDSDVIVLDYDILVLDCQPEGFFAMNWHLRSQLCLYQSTRVELVLDFANANSKVLRSSTFLLFFFCESPIIRAWKSVPTNEYSLKSSTEYLMATHCTIYCTG